MRRWILPWLVLILVATLVAPLAPVHLAHAVAPGGLWSDVGPLGTGRSVHTATLLADGRVLVAGGRVNGTADASAELYDPATATWSATDSLDTARALHTATRLLDGRVLVVGGEGLVANNLAS